MSKKVKNAKIGLYNSASLVFENDEKPFTLLVFHKNLVKITIRS